MVNPSNIERADKNFFFFSSSSSPSPPRYGHASLYIYIFRFGWVRAGSVIDRKNY